MKQSVLLVLVLKVVGQKWNQTQSLFWLKDSVEFDSMAPLQLHWMATCVPGRTQILLKRDWEFLWNFGCPPKVHMLFTFLKNPRAQVFLPVSPEPLRGDCKHRGSPCLGQTADGLSQLKEPKAGGTGSPGGRFRESGPNGTGQWGQRPRCRWRGWLESPKDFS